MDILSNRELALSIWILISIIFVLSIPKLKEIRKQIKQILKTLFSKTFIVIYLFMTFYIILIVVGIWKIGLWESHQIKNTLIWVFSVAILSFVKINSIKDDPNFFINTVKDNFKIVVIIEFIIGFYSFSLFIEILLLPVLVFISAFLAYSQTDNKYKVVEKFINNIFAIFGILIIFYSIYMLTTNFDEFVNIQTIYDFYIPPLLTILYLPFIFLILVYITYENIFVRLQFFIKKKTLIRFTKLYIIYRFHFKIKKLERWASILQFQDSSSKKGIINSIKLIFKIYNIEKNPPKILPQNGWSPYKAKEFLTSEGIETNFYNPLGNDEWSSHSNFIDIGNDFMANKLVFYIDGNETTLNSLKIILSIFNKKTAKSAHAKFLSCIKTLLKAASNFDITKEIEMSILKGKNKTFNIGSFTATIEKNAWSKKHDTNYDVKFILSK